MSKILICDDDPEIVSILESQLKGEGHECVQAVDGLDGFPKAINEKVDFVITDLEMPKWSGQEMIHSLSGIIGGKLKVIVITGRQEDTRIKELKEYPNVIEVFPKPWDREKLVQTIQDNAS